MTRNFVPYVVGSLKSGEELAAIYFGIVFARKKEFLPQLYTRELLCFGNSAELATVRLPRLVEPGGMVYW